MNKYMQALVLMGTVLASPAWSDEILVSKVIVSTIGLANFELHADVDGNEALQFPVRLEQVDDILKSLVVFDPEGRLGGVTLPGKQPLTEIFKDLPFTKEQLSDPSALFNAYQGAEVTVKGGDLNATGKILFVQPEEVALEGGRTVTKHRLSLMTDNGVRQAVLEDAQSVQFADEKIRNEINRALSAVRESSTSGNRMLTVNVLGNKDRDVTLSYVVDAPLWKTAYRVVLPDGGKDKGLLQGWAVIENMTASDWKNVDLTLVSGNPVTYRQSLYQAYYVSRPEIPVQVFGRVMPRVDQGALASAADAESLKKERMGMLQERGMPAAAPAMMMAKSAMAADMAVPQESFAGGAANGVVSSMANVAQMANAAESAEATTQVLFRFPDRFSLKSGQSMMLPFVSKTVPMHSVFVYQPETNATHPLAAVEVLNDGETGLPPGILTIYEESALLKGTSFVGDAQMAVVGPGEKRLVSYALDSKTNISKEDKSISTEGEISISQGVIRTSVVNRSETVYTIKAPAKEDRTVILEHPKMYDYKLVTPDPKDAEVTDTHYRIKVPVKAGESKTVSVVLENQTANAYGIDGLPTSQLMAYATSQGKLSPAARKAFEELAKIRQEMDTIDQQIMQIDQQRQAIFEDQERVRENLQSLDSKSDVKDKYLNKLNQQEDQIASLDEKKRDLSVQRAKIFAELKQKISEMNF